ncbi:MAG: hypothetical protein IJ060_09920 [Oscillospiraceae bacterium]|nr:hypothetical protein [Oscillospiraceae bacterium]
MNAERFSGLLNELPDEMIEAAMKKKRRLHISHSLVRMTAAAACLTAAVGGVWILMRGQKQDPLLTEQSRGAEITEVTGSGMQTTFDVLQTETTVTSATGTTGSTGSTGTGVTGTQPAGTAAPANTQTAPADIPVSRGTQPNPAPGTAAPAAAQTTAPPAETTAAASSAPAETTEPSVYREAIGNYTIPKPLADVIAAEIGTDEFYYYLEGGVPVSYLDKWDEAEISIFTKDRSYFVSCSVTATDYLTLMMPDVPDSAISVVSPADFSGKYEGEVLFMDLGADPIDHKYMYGFVPNYMGREEGSAEEIAAMRAKKARWAWDLLCAIKDIPDTRIEMRAFHTEEGMFSLPYVPEEFEPVYVVRDMDAQTISSVTYTDGEVTQELSAEQIEEMVNWWNQLGDFTTSSGKVDISSHKADNRYLTIFFNEPFAFYRNTRDMRFGTSLNGIIKMIIAEREDGTRIIRYNKEQWPERSSFVVEEGLDEIYHP